MHFTRANVNSSHAAPPQQRINTNSVEWACHRLVHSIPIASRHDRSPYEHNGEKSSFRRKSCRKWIFNWNVICFAESATNSALAPKFYFRNKPQPKPDPSERTQTTFHWGTPFVSNNGTTHDRRFCYASRAREILEHNFHLARANRNEMSGPVVATPAARTKHNKSKQHNSLRNRSLSSAVALCVSPSPWRHSDKSQVRKTFVKRQRSL